MSRFCPIVILFMIFICSCERTDFSNKSDLKFSMDTIHFDTVFSSIGSTTRELRVFNRDKWPVTIDHVFLGAGENSSFRLNIDGEAVNEKYDIQIEARDSLYIFVDALINPLNSNSPVVILDSIVFEMGGKISKVLLMAWGQDVYVVKNKLIKSESWNSGKPYLVYGNSIVDTLEMLTINEGTRIYFHRNSSLIVAGSLVVNGTEELPVLFSSDRLEEVYEDIPAQWNGIHFLNTSQGNSINHAEIRNTVYGVRIGEAYTSSIVPDLKIFNSTIAHSSVSGISAMKADIQAGNNQIFHCGSYCVYIEAGGNYTFTHCTMSNRWEYGFRLTSLLYISEKAILPGIETNQLNLNLRNCAVFGNISSEIYIVPFSNQYTGNYFFDHCLIKLDTIASPFWTRSRFPANIVNRDPLFFDEMKYDFRPDTLSPLINAGSTSYLLEFPSDLRGVSRITDGKPDIGAFERIPGEMNE